MLEKIKEEVTRDILSLNISTNSPPPSSSPINSPQPLSLIPHTTTRILERERGRKRLREREREKREREKKRERKQQEEKGRRKRKRKP